MASSVSLVRAQSYDRLRASLLEVLAPLGGMATTVEPGDRVLLKPNLLTGSKPKNECVTRLELVASVAELVREAGGEPFLGDSPAFGSARGVALQNGYGELLETLPVVEFSGGRVATDNPRFAHLLLSEEAIAADKVINLPKVKSHCQLTLTLGVKNLFGCVPGKMKAWWHMEAGKDAARFGEMLVETARQIAPELTIADGIVAHQGNGPSNGEPRALGVLAASTDLFALDVALAAILQVDPRQVPTLAAAARLGLSPELGAIAFPLLDPAELAVADWQLAPTMHPIDFGAPRVLRSLVKHLYIRFIREPLSAYSAR